MHPDIPATLRHAIESGCLVAGMSREIVVASVGWPEERETIAAPGGPAERWTYGDLRRHRVLTHLCFRGRILVTIEQDALSQSAVALAGIDRALSLGVAGRTEPGGLTMK
jgi:hypothetical protein